MPSRKKSVTLKHAIPASVRNRLRRIRLVVLDVDGVLTDGRMVYTEDGVQLKFFDVYDGFGIARAVEKGLHLAILSRGKSGATKIRCSRLGIRNIYQGVQNKLETFNEICVTFGVTPEQCCFVGDDVYDLPVLDAVGFSVAPASAFPPIKRKVDFVTTLPGGRGAVREILDMILEAQELI